MKFQKKVLKNGLTVLHEKRDVPVTTVMLAAKYGSAYESVEEKGMAHFMEHLCFKGTEKRTVGQIADEVEKVGGELNAFTHEEVTAYHVRLPSDKLDVAMDVIFDVFFNPVFPEEEVEKEANVICEEIKMYRDNPHMHAIEMIKKNLDTTRFTLIEKAVSNVDDKQVKFYLSYKENFDHIKMLHKYRWIDESDYLDKNLNRSGASSLKPGLDTVSEVCFVETITLDTWAKEANIEHIDFIWVDVQGAERSVIEGAEHMLQHTDYIFTEFGEDQYQDYLSRERTFHEFISRGFEVVPAHTSAGEKGNALFRRGDL